MSETLYIMIGKQYQKEIESVLKSESFDDVKIVFYPPFCKDKNGKNSFDKKNCRDLDVPCNTNSKKSEDFSENSEDIQLYMLPEFFYILTGETIVDVYLQDDAFLTITGWLEHWQEYLEEWKYDKKKARQFFGESMKKVVLLDTGVNSKSVEQLKNFSSFVDLPYEVLQIGLDYFRLFLRIIVYKWRLENKIKEHIAALDKADT